MNGMLALAQGDTSAAIDAHTGGAVASLKWRGIDLLRPAGEGATVREMGMFVLAPYSNRIGLGALPGETRLAANFPGEPHSIHGFGWQRAWQVSGAGADWACLELVHAPDEHWPFSCRATLNIALRTDGVRMQLSLRNNDTRPMPAGLGFHPFFPVDAATCLQAQWDGRWELDAARLPTHLTTLSTRDDFSAPRSVGGWQVDNCFTGWPGRATLSYAHHCVRIEAGPECPYVVCFRPADGRPFVAIEPVSHVSNAHQLEQRGVTGTGLRWLAPAETFSIRMAIRAMPTTRQP
ncbi:hypothetical protein CR105_09115 [Massilia eurypsychrophila]|jgi:aldose 1-epimerase|uniref:Aldose epimerase n=1 Tax=Massilia eurypsychrophila TaxID=1485217 RepID=A0A2G8TGY9_9BURK|nr:aldose 1-epimerase [Massilia eurypsychrophila]PIL45327.1 hypothetical protein CR105_09115 [Massilia eurypsychrophila]